MPDERPNVLLILTDHWRGDTLGRFGHPVAETPHLDSMSANAVTFTNAFSPCPSCIAARRSMMTGMTPDSHGMLGYQDGQPWPYANTLAGNLARAGYQTINVGKTHFYPPRLHLGFEELILLDDYEEWLEEQTGLERAIFAHGVHGNSWIARPNHLPETQMEETWLTDQAMRRIKKRDTTRPFFLCLSFRTPHPPWCPPEHYYNRFMEKSMPPPVEGEWSRKHAENASYPMDVNTWRGKISPEEMQRASAGYYGYCAYIDAQIGRFMEYLGRCGLSRNTMIVFTSDHGEMLGDHNLWRKTYAYDGSARIPCIVRPPLGWDTERNTESEQLVGLEDLMPSFLQSAGEGIPDTVDGRSFLPLLKGDTTNWREYYHHEHSSCYEEENAYQCLTSVKWKYIWNPVTGEEQLFDREKDPYEECDLAEDRQYKDKLGELRQLLAAHLRDRPENLSDGEQLTPTEIPVWRDPREREQ